MMSQAIPSQSCDSLQGHAGEEPSSRIHILYVIDELRCTLGGGERILLKMIENLPRDRFRCSLLTFFLDPGADYLKNLRCPLHVLPMHRSYDWHSLKLALQFRRLLRSQGVDIVQTFFETSDLWAGPLTKMVSPARLIWSRRDMGILRSRKHVISYRLLAGIPDRVLAVSEEVRQFCIKNDHLAPHKVTTVYNGIEARPFNPAVRNQIRAELGIPVDAPVVITIANVRRLKGIDVLLRAMAIVRKSVPDISFVVVGDVVEQDYYLDLQTEVRRLSLETQVRFLGSKEDVWPYLRMSDVFVLPSRSEGFSNALLEAMAAGLPCIASRVGGNGEAIQSTATGLLFESEDHKMLAEKLSWLLHRPQVAKEMGQSAAITIQARFGNDRMMSELIRIYEELVRT